MPETLANQLRIASAKQAAAIEIEKALRAAGWPYHVWIIAANLADAHEAEAARLSAEITAPTIVLANAYELAAA